MAGRSEPSPPYPYTPVHVIGVAMRKLRHILDEGRVPDTSRIVRARRSVETSAANLREYQFGEALLNLLNACTDVGLSFSDLMREAETELLVPAQVRPL